MLKCRDIAIKATDYVEKKQTLGERLAFASHLLICGRCREFVRHLRTSIQYFHDMPANEIPQQQAEDIAEKVRNLPKG